MIPTEKAAAILAAFKFLDLAIAEADPEYAKEQSNVARTDAGDQDKIDNFVHNMAQRLVCEDMSFLTNYIEEVANDEG